MKMRERLYFPDVWRGLAVLVMVVFHILFIGRFWYNWPIEVSQGPLRWLGWAAGGSFLFIAGWSAWLRLRDDGNRPHHFERAWHRCAQIGFWGFVITAATMVAVPQAPVWWGILHCLAVSLLFAHILLAVHLRWAAVFTGFTVIVASFFLPSVPGNVWTLPFGIPPLGFSSIDYYPLLPFGGIVLVSAGLGPYWTRLTSGFEPFLAQPWPGKSLLLWIGRNSLMVYVIHVPIIVALLWLLAQV